MPNLTNFGSTRAGAPPASQSVQGPTDWETYGLDTFANNGDKSAAVLAAAAKALGISQNDPTFQAAAKQADVASKVGWGGPSPDQIEGLVTRDYNNLVANPANPGSAATSDALTNLKALYGSESSMANPYAAGSPIMQSLQNQTMNQGQRQAHDMLGSLFGGGATSGEVHAAQNNLAAQTNTNLQNQLLLAPQWDQQHLADMAALNGQMANTALAGRSLDQNAYQFDTTNSQTQAQNNNSWIGPTLTAGGTVLGALAGGPVGAAVGTAAGTALNNWLNPQQPSRMGGR